MLKRNESVGVAVLDVCETIMIATLCSTRELASNNG